MVRDHDFRLTLARAGNKPALNLMRIPVLPALWDKNRKKGSGVKENDTKDEVRLLFINIFLIFILPFEKIQMTSF